MGLNVSRSTEPLRFDTGIGNASYTEIMDSPVSGQPQKPLMPGSTTVSQAVDALFPTDRAVGDQIMAALVAANPTTLRTPNGFLSAARSAAHSLRSRGSSAADAAAHEIETLLADADLFERYRLALLET